MVTPLSVPAVPAAFPSVWRAIFSLRFLRSLRWLPKLLFPAGPARAPATSHLGTFDWDEPDTSLTQAEIEVLK
jgi:hypothetical protein